MARWAEGEQTVQYRLEQNRLETVESGDFRASADAQIGRAVLRIDVTAAAALKGGDVDGPTSLLMTATGWPQSPF